MINNGRTTLRVVRHFLGVGVPTQEGSRGIRVGEVVLAPPLVGEVDAVMAKESKTPAEICHFYKHLV